MQRLIWLFVWLIAASLIAVPSAAGQAPGDQVHPPGKIVFTSDRDGDPEIYIMNEDGSDQRRLTEQPGFDAMPDFSPDGTHIAFISARAGNQDVWVMNTDGGDLRQLTQTPGMEFHPAWSPDGTHIAFMAKRGTNIDVYVMNADGSDERRLTDDPALDGQPAWSPDGRQIAFASQRDGNWQIYVMDADGSSVQRLTEDDTDDSYPRFSPDGTRIIYEAMTHAASIDTTELYTMNADGSSVQRLTDNDYFDSMPVWSADGSQLVFVSNRDGDWSLYRMDADGSSVTQLTSENAHHQAWWQPPAPSGQPSLADIAGQVIAFDSEAGSDREIYLMNGDGSYLHPITDNDVNDGLPDWSPDGTQLVFFSNRDGDDEIFVMMADGSDPRQLTFNDAQDRAPAWSPDGTRIAFASNLDVNYEIYVMNADGSNLQRLTENTNKDFSPAWSPDGTQIVYTAEWSGSKQDLYIIDVPAGIDTLPEPRLLSESAARAAWSPDGTRLAFSSNRNGDWEIFVMNSDGSDPQQVTDNVWADWVPTWSPDGEWLAWAGESGPAAIYVMHVASGYQAQLTDNSAQDWRPAWRPVAPPEPAARPAILLVFGQQFIPTIYETEVPLLEEAGYSVIVASRTLDPLAAKQSPLRVEPDLLLEDVRVEDYEAIIFNCDNDLTFGSAKDQTNRIAQDATAAGKVVGAICSGPRVLAYADVVAGKIVTGEPSQTCRMLEDAGAICTGAQVERDGLIITARDRYAASRFTSTIIEALDEPPSPTAAPDIVYYSEADGNAEIYVMNADGSDPQRLTFNDTDDTSPAWSPDGARIVFISDRNDPNPAGCFPNCNADIYVMDADGTHERQLTSDPAIESHPDWSPDGQTILFDADRDGDGTDEIWRMNVDGSDQQVLIDSGFNDHWADWSPDGTQIVFVSDRDGQPEIYVADTNGTNPQRLTDNDLGEYFPAWSPDGSRIAFMTAAQRSRHLYILAQDEQGSWQVIDLGIEGEDPAWSPDGSQILFQDDRDGDFEIYAVDAAGGTPRQLTTNRIGDFWPDWRPGQ